MTEIRVTGTGRVSTAPDEAQFHFQCAGFALTAKDALAAATAVAHAVVEVLDGAGIPMASRGVQRSSVRPRIRYDEHHQIREGWDAMSTIECTTGEIDEAFDLLDRVASVPDVSIDGPNWIVLPDNIAHETAHQRAVVDGHAKAVSYSNAAGLTLGELLELIEGGAAHRPMERHAMMAAEAGGLDPAEQSVAASITLVYYAS